MPDGRFKKYENCKIWKVYQRLYVTPVNISLHEYLIIAEVKQENSHIPNFINIEFSGEDIYFKLMDLLAGKCKRVYAAYGMADIDFFRYGDKYCIESSPNEASYNHFYFDQSNFKKFVAMLAPDNIKEQTVQ